MAGSTRWWTRSPPRIQERVSGAARGERPALEPDRSPSGSATSSGPRAARSPPAETNPGPAISASASSTVRLLTTPLRSSSSPTGRSRILPRNPDLAVTGPPGPPGHRADRRDRVSRSRGRTRGRRWRRPRSGRRDRPSPPPRRGEAEHVGEARRKRPASERATVHARELAVRSRKRLNVRSRSREQMHDRRALAAAVAPPTDDLATHARNALDS